MSVERVDRRPAGVLVMWVHAVVLLVVCPAWAGIGVTATAGFTAGWAAFLAFAAVGAVVVWRVRNNWRVRR